MALDMWITGLPTPFLDGVGVLASPALFSVQMHNRELININCTRAISIVVRLIATDAHR